MTDLRDLAASVRVGSKLPDDPAIRRIAVVRANNIGDFVVATPAFRALRASYPDAEIVHVGDPRVRTLVERLPHLIDRFVEFPGFPGIRERRIEPRSIVEFLAGAQEERFDLAIQLHGNGVWSNPFTSLLGARITAGFIRPEDSAEAMGLDRSLVHPRDRHETLRLLDLLGEIGIPPFGLEPVLGLRQTDRDEAHAVLAAAGIDTSDTVVGLHPGGRFADRIWPADRFAQLARRLADGGPRVVLTGAGGDRRKTEEVLARAGGGVVDLTDALSLPGLAALISRLNLFVSNDTGPAHIAYAAGTPSVTIFGTVPAWEWGSLVGWPHLSVEPPASGPDEQRAPIDRVEVEDVWRVVSGLLAAADGRVASPDSRDSRGTLFVTSGT